MVSKSGIRKITLLCASMMTMMAGAVVAPSLPQINAIFESTQHADILTRLIITLPAIFIAVFSPIFGKFSDSIGRKKILISALVLYSFSGVTGYFLNNLYFILVGRAFLGIAVAGIMTMTIALIGDYFKGAERSQFMGFQGAFMGVGGVLFISLAGWLADFGWHVPFLIYLFGFLVLPFALIYLYEPDQFKKEYSDDKAITTHDGYSKRVIFIIYAIIFFGIIAFYMIPVQIPYLLKSVLKVTNAQVGMAIAAQSLSGALVAINYRKIKNRLSFCTIYQIAFLLMAVGFLGVGLSHQYWHYILGLVISGLGVGLLMPTGNMWIIEVAPEKIRGKLVGNANTAMFIGMFISPILIQPIINLSSLAFSFIVMAIGLIIFVIFLKVLKHNQHKISPTIICKNNNPLIK